MSTMHFQANSLGLQSTKKIKRTTNVRSVRSMRKGSLVMHNHYKMVLVAVVMTAFLKEQSINLNLLPTLIGLFIYLFIYLLSRIMWEKFYEANKEVAELRSRKGYGFGQRKNDDLSGKVLIPAVTSILINY